MDNLHVNGVSRLESILHPGSGRNIDLGNMQKPFKVLPKFHKYTEIGYICNRSCAFRVGFIFLYDIIPRIGKKLFYSESYSPVLFIHVQDYSLYFLILLKDILGMRYPLGPGKIGNVY